MKIDFKLTEDNLLTYHLFSASQSKGVRKRRAKGKIFMMLIYMALGFFIWERNGVTTAAMFFLVCLPLYFLYAFMEKRQYVNHFSSFIRKNYQDQLGMAQHLDLNTDTIIYSAESGENKIPVQDLEAITELQSMYILDFKNTPSIILPKDGLPEPAQVKNQLSELIGTSGVPFHDMMTWKWK